MTHFKNHEGWSSISETRLLFCVVYLRPEDCHQLIEKRVEVLKKAIS